MNTRTIPIIVFVIWSLICWRWYVCGIKQQCSPPTAEAANPITPMAPPAAAPSDTAGQAAAQNAIRPSDERRPQPTSPDAKPQSSTAASAAQRNLNDDISSAQVVAVEDRVLIHFPYGSTRRVDDDAIDTYLSELTRALVASRGHIVLIGHTDNIGDSASNQRMALQRAQHIKAILVKKGAASSQITCKSMGERQPLATNDNPTGRYKNRRVEVRIK
jgi:OmpA-OmpF porin, OOP family